MSMENAPAPEPSWFEASEQVLEPLLTARALVALLDGAERVGLFRALRTTSAFDELTRQTGLPEQRVREICGALVTNEVLEPLGDGVRLTPSWRVLTGPSALARSAPRWSRRKPLHGS